MPSLITEPLDIVSSFADDPDLREIVELFVDELPAKLAAMVAQFQSKNWNELRTLAHQMKGSAGSYGFDALTHYAARLEGAVKANRSTDEVDDIQEALNDLLDISRRVRK